MKEELLLIPNKEIERIIQFYNVLSQQEIKELYEEIIHQILNWLEKINLNIYKIEKNIKNDIEMDKEELQTVERLVAKMDPIIQLLPELMDLIENRIKDTTHIIKIQSEWSSLQHYLVSIKNLLLNQLERRMLLNQINELIFKTDEISNLIFNYQEKKFTTINISASLSESTNNSGSLLDDSTIYSREEVHHLLEIDQIYDLVLNQIEFLYQKLYNTNDEFLLNRFKKLKEKWDHVQFERDELKSEQKEDRWLIIFKRVSDKVDIMIDGLDRSITQCYSFINQIKKSNKKGFFSSFTKKPMDPIDLEKFKSVEKSFEAKYKYYTPSIDRMLNMLGNSINARPLKDIQTIQRHESMLSRWFHLKNVMNELRTKDLIETDKYSHNHWKSIKLIRHTPTTPEPTILKERRDSIMSDTNSSTTTNSSFKRTPRPTSKKYDFYDEDEKSFGLDMSKLTNTHHAKTTVTARSKSSLGHLNTVTSVSTTRRAITPSLIPRPKTPSKQQLIQRPKSYQTPPVPPLPKYLQKSNHKEYIPDPKDPLDIEISKIINSNPIQIQCQRATVGRYYFGNESSVSINGGKKLYTCKLMTYQDRKRKSSSCQNKVLIRVGGGWQDLDFFLLDHSSFMSSVIPSASIKKKNSSNLLNQWKN